MKNQSMRKEVERIFAKGEPPFPKNHRGTAEHVVMLIDPEHQLSGVARLDKIHEVIEVLEYIWAQGWTARDLEDARTT